MKLFDYMKDDRKRILGRLEETSQNYDVWPRDRVFESAKKALESLRLHFYKETLLVNNLKEAQSIRSCVGNAAKQRSCINDDVESIVMIHVDEPESSFEELLNSIFDKLKAYDTYCEKIYYPALLKHLSEEDMGHAREQMDQLVLS